jgi:PAS domain S-box-containing protein
VETVISDSRIPSIASLGQVPNHDPGGHVVQLYTDDGFLLNVVSRFVGSALAVGDAVVVIATKDHREGLAQLLNDRGIDPVKAISQGRFILLDALETLSKFMVNGSLDEKRFIDTIGSAMVQVRTASGNTGSRIAVFGEMVALLWAEGNHDAALRLEELWNNLALEHSFSLLCAYPITGFNHATHVEPFLKICSQHSGVLPSERYLTLDPEEERFRSIAHLQQRSQVLENELALHQSEQRFRLLTEAVQDYAIFMLDPKGHIISWNRGAQRIKGYGSLEIIGKHFSCFYSEEDLRNGRPQMVLEVAAKEGRFEDEGWRLRKDGSRFWANVTITAVRDETGALIGFGKVTRDATTKMEAERALQKEVEERRQIERRLSDSEQSLRRLSLHLLRTQDEERRRIGRDLHDSVGQYLAVLKMRLDSLSLSTGNQEVASREIAECIRLAEDSIKEVRTVSYLLHPPMLDEQGLKSAVPWYVDGFSARSGIQICFEMEADFGRLSPEAELALFRVLQESLTNVHRHSGSSTAHVRLFLNEEMAVLQVEDQGSGVSSGLLKEWGRNWIGALGVGLRGMNERMRQLGGRLELVSTEQGTTVSGIVPAAIATSEPIKVSARPPRIY